MYIACLTQFPKNLSVPSLHKFSHWKLIFENGCYLWIWQQNVTTLQKLKNIFIYFECDEESLLFIPSSSMSSSSSEKKKKMESHSTWLIHSTHSYCVECWRYESNIGSGMISSCLVNSLLTIGRHLITSHTSETHIMFSSFLFLVEFSSGLLTSVSPATWKSYQC